MTTGLVENALNGREVEQITMHSDEGSAELLPRKGHDWKFWNFKHGEQDEEWIVDSNEEGTQVARHNCKFIAHIKFKIEIDLEEKPNLPTPPTEEPTPTNEDQENTVSNPL